MSPKVKSAVTLAGKQNVTSKRNARALSLEPTEKDADNAQILSSITIIKRSCAPSSYFHSDLTLKFSSSAMSTSVYTDFSSASIKTTSGNLPLLSQLIASDDQRLGVQPKGSAALFTFPVSVHEPVLSAFSNGSRCTAPFVRASASMSSV